MPKTFIALYEHYFDDVYRYIYFKTGSKWETDDLTSETFTKAYEKYEGLKGNEKAWLFVIARNTVIDFYRRRKDISLDGSEEQYESPSRFDTELEERETSASLKKALRELSSEDAEIISLKYFANMKHREIAALLNKSEGAVKMQISRTVEKLKMLMSGVK